MELVKDVMFLVPSRRRGHVQVQTEMRVSPTVASTHTWFQRSWFATSTHIRAESPVLLSLMAVQGPAVPYGCSGWRLTGGNTHVPTVDSQECSHSDSSNISTSSQVMSTPWALNPDTDPHLQSFQVNPLLPAC